MMKNTDNKKLEDIVKEIMQNHELGTDNDQNKTRKVIHYTSMDALVSMLKKTRCQCDNDTPKGKHKFLRIFNSENFNDPTEGTYLFQNPKNQKESNLQQLMLGYGHDSIISTNSVYIGSFVDVAGSHQEHPHDDINMWIRYGAEGKGVSMTITAPQKYLYKVKYGRQQADKTATNLSNYANKELQKQENLNDQDKLRWAKVDIIENLLEIRYLYKDEAYRHESECRYIRRPSEFHTRNPINAKITEFRVKYKNGIFQSYMEIPELSICKTSGIFQQGSSITIGPTVNNQKDARRYINHLLDKAGIHTQVKISKVPYRQSNNK